MTTAPDVLETPRRRARSTTPPMPAEMDVDVARPKDSRLYWCGTLSDCPRHNLALGGVPFTATSDLVQDLAGGETRRVPRNGSMAWMTPAQVERVKASIADRVVRRVTAGRPATATDPGVPATYAVITRTPGAASRYVEHLGDEPLGRYVYLYDVEAQARALGPMWRDGEPPPYQA